LLKAAVWLGLQSPEEKGAGGRDLRKKKKKRKGKHEMRAACGQEADVSECLLCPKEVGLWTHFTDRLGEVKRLGRPVFK
jgi:hypothetical protein